MSHILGIDLLPTHVTSQYGFISRSIYNSHNLTFGRFNSSHSSREVWERDQSRQYVQRRISKSFWMKCCEEHPKFTTYHRRPIPTNYFCSDFHLFHHILPLFYCHLWLIHLCYLNQSRSFSTDHIVFTCYTRRYGCELIESPDLGKNFFNNFHAQDSLRPWKFISS